jgi:hypothetical protein
MAARGEDRSDSMFAEIKFADLKPNRKEILKSVYSAVSCFLVTWAISIFWVGAISAGWHSEWVEPRVPEVLMAIYLTVGGLLVTVLGKKVPGWLLYPLGLALYLAFVLSFTPSWVLAIQVIGFFLFHLLFSKYL